MTMSDPMLHIGLVRREVKHWRWAFNALLQQEDLEQEGLRGVLRALETFDESRGTKFSTYAVPWIRHFIQREVYASARTVRVPMAVGKAAWKRGEPISLTTTSLDDPNLGFNDPDRTDGQHAFAAALGMYADPEVMGVLEGQDRAELVAHLLTTIPEREARVLKLRFFDDLTLHETGRVMGITRERTRQIQVQALERIAKRLLVEEYR